MENCSSAAWWRDRPVTSLIIAPPLVVQADEIDEICRRVGLALADALA
ncbi:MAG: hypothetical protein IPG43_23550 [Proteobacteria bacterium]|nr:hypothetical protein [Pseudomonadota bacterium]